MAGVLLVCLVVLEVWLESTATITGPPSSVVSPLYKLANFTCDGVGNKLYWTVQGNSLTDAIIQDREISVNTTNNISVDVWSSVLTIRALPINDGIVVGCVVLTLPDLSIDQKGASLTVLG